MKNYFVLFVAGGGGCGFIGDWPDDISFIDPTYI